jgi:hypothetical protein
LGIRDVEEESMADIDKIRMEDIDITEERVRRKHQVTATHRPTGASVTRDGISYYITYNDALTSLEERVTELEGEDEDESDDRREVGE